MLRLIVKEGLLFSGKIILVAGVALITVIIFWPYYRVEPFQKLAQMFSEMSGHDWSYVQLYLGQIHSAADMPWHYPVVYLTLTLPSFYLLFAVFGIGASLRSKGNTTLVWRAQVLFLIATVMPPALHVLLGTPVYGGMRHWLLIYPFFSCIIALGMLHTVQYLQSKGRPLFVAAIVLLIFVFLNQIYQNAKLFPFTYIYFNSLLKNEVTAQRFFTLDHRKQARKYAKLWIKKQPVARKVKGRYFVCYAKSFNKSEPQVEVRKPEYIVTKQGAQLAHIYFVPKKQVQRFKSNLNDFCNSINTK